MDERDEVRLMMITLADISVDTRDILALRGSDEEDDDERKMTPDEIRAWHAASTARIEELRRHIARIEAELARRRKPA